jgi:glycosyltransferase involved in cell wall biosynthesis
MPPRSTEPSLICVGRLQQSKGQDILIQALPALVKHFPTVLVEFLGEGPMRTKYQALAKDLGVEGHCRFLGKVELTQVLSRMAAAWLTVVPSRTEAFGLVNVESMSVATPVVASNVGGIPDIVSDGLNGFLVPPCNPEALATKLGLLLGDKTLREKMGRNARDRFCETFEQSAVVKEQVDWLELLV